MHVGGQAVIEGVMMRSKDRWSVAVRDQKGDIHVKKESLIPLPKVFRLPLVRGVIGLYQALSIGIRALNFSASKAYGEEEQMSPLAIAVTIVVAFLLGIGLFIFLPLYLTKVSGSVFSVVNESAFVYNFLDGILRIVFFLLYLVLIGLWKDMRRIFEYHGAEHKVIYAYESGTDLSVENVKHFSTHHPRCGTSFLFIVIILSIMVFSFIPKTWEFVLKFGSRIVLIPLIAGISYELLRLSSRMKDNSIINAMIRPGLLLQHITTKEPDQSQVEVALRALKEVVPGEEGND